MSRIGPHRARRRSDLQQHPVADRLAERVVDFLEAVEIERQNSANLTAPVTPHQPLEQVVVEHRRIVASPMTNVGAREQLPPRRADAVPARPIARAHDTGRIDAIEIIAG